MSTITRTRKKRYSIQNICYIALWVFCILFCLLTFQLKDGFDGFVQKQPVKEAIIMISQGDLLRFIPRSARRVWDEREFLVVLGIPSLDIPMRRWRRRMQRTSCWQFSEVATRYNNYTGAILVLYFLAIPSFNNFVFSNALAGEAAQWRDVVIYPMNEEQSSTDKMVRGSGYWGVEAEIMSSRKTFFWFQFALRQFHRVPYFAKGDDELFLSVPQYLEDLRRLPRKRIYWGKYVSQNVYINKKKDKVKVRYMLGFCYTLARDTAESLVSYRPMQRLVALPYNNNTEPEFSAMNMQHEDVMVGRVLRRAGFPVIYVAEGSARFHSFSNLPINNNAIAIQKPEENEYYKFMTSIINRKVEINSTQIIQKESDLYLMQAAL